MQSYKDLTILKFQEIQTALEMNPNSPTNQWYDILPLLTNKTRKEYVLMPYVKFAKEVKKFEWLDEVPKTDEFVKKFECDGEWFLVEQYATDWNTETFVSMSSLTKDRSQIVNNLHLILATCCYKVKGEIIDLTEFDRRSKLFQNKLNILVAYPIGFFFALFLAKLSTTTQFYSHVKKKQNLAKKIEKSKKMQSGSQRNGLGILQSIRS